MRQDYQDDQDQKQENAPARARKGEKVESSPDHPGNPGRFTWVVWADRYPDTPVELGQVRGDDRAAAELEAKRLFPGRRIRVQSAASARETSRTMAALPAPRKPFDRSNARRSARRAAKRSRNMTEESDD